MKWTNASAGKIQAKRFNDAWGKLNWENNTFVELTGVIGQNERSSTLTNIFGSNVREDVTAVKEKIGSAYQWTVTASNAAEIIKAIEAELPALKANRPVQDKRETPEVRAERNAEFQRIDQERREKERKHNETFTALYGNGQTVTVRPGQMAITARVCYDNSDSMTDYFDRHASLSPRFALLVVPKQAETERLARQGLAAGAAVLSGFTFQWHTEKYSMGHGNYLESKEGFDLPPELIGTRNYYRGGEVTRAHWEIEFEAAYSEPKEFQAIKGYGSQPAPPASEPVTVDGVTVSENTEKDGIEIRFPSKPSAEVIDSLKAHGWRWSRFSKCWYKRASDQARKFANDLTAKAERQAQAMTDAATCSTEELEAAATIHDQLTA